MGDTGWHVVTFNAEYPYAVVSPDGRVVAWCASEGDAEMICDALNAREEAGGDG